MPVAIYHCVCTVSFLTVENYFSLLCLKSGKRKIDLKINVLPEKWKKTHFSLDVKNIKQFLTCNQNMCLIPIFFTNLCYHSGDRVDDFDFHSLRR